MATFTSTPHRMGPARFQQTDEDEQSGTLHARDEIVRDLDGRVIARHHLGPPDRDWLIADFEPPIERPDEPVP